MSDTDELATIINDNEVAAGGRWTTYPHVTAAAILAAGYRKPRIIDTAYEDGGVDDLPRLSVVLSGGSPAIMQADRTFMDYDGSFWDFWEMEYPLTVLWEPQP